MITPQSEGYTVPMLKPPNTILELSMMYAVSRCLHVIAEMGVADALGDDPRTSADLAETTGANSDALAPLSGSCRLTGSSSGVMMFPGTRVSPTRQPRGCFGRIIRSPCGLLSAWGVTHLTGKPSGCSLTPYAPANLQQSKSPQAAPGHSMRNIPKRAASLTKP